MVFTKQRKQYKKAKIYYNIKINVLSFFKIEKQEVCIQGGDFNYLNFNNPFERASKAVKIIIPIIHKIKNNGVQSNATFAESLQKQLKRKNKKLQNIRNIKYEMLFTGYTQMRNM